MKQIIALESDKTPTPVDRIIRYKWVILGGLGAAAILPIPAVIALWFLAGDAMRAFLGSQFWFSILMMGLSLFIIIHLCAACILAERKLSAYTQDRQGPNRVGWGGILQPVADGIKFILKEEYIPKSADRPLFVLAPALAFIVALLGFAVIPWAGEIVWPWNGPDGQPARVTTQTASLDIGILYMLAMGAVSVYGVVLAGWASNNKYAHYGGMRATAQMLSYEVPLGLGILVIIMAAGTLRLEDVLNQQAQTGIWNLFAHPIAFILVLIGAFAETNRAPFDLAECEQELIAGYHTEYSAMKFGMFFLAEYAHMVTNSAMIVTIFLGGYHFWGVTDACNAIFGPNSWITAIVHFHVIWIKIFAMLAFYMLIRWTLPRFRFDQLMRMAWKSLVPIGMAVVVATGLLIAFGWKIDPKAGLPANLFNMLIALAANAVVIAGALWVSRRTKVPITGRQDYLPPVQVARSAASLAAQNAGRSMLQEQPLGRVRLLFVRGRKSWELPQSERPRAEHLRHTAESLREKPRTVVKQLWWKWRPAWWRFVAPREWVVACFPSRIECPVRVLRKDVYETRWGRTYILEVEEPAQACSIPVARFRNRLRPVWRWIPRGEFGNRRVSSPAVIDAILSLWKSSGRVAAARLPASAKARHPGRSGAARARSRRALSRRPPTSTTGGADRPRRR